MPDEEIKAPKEAKEIDAEQEESRAGEKKFSDKILIRGDDGPFESEQDEPLPLR